MAPSLPLLFAMLFACLPEKEPGTGGDDSLSTGECTWYQDQDGDGFGSPDLPVVGGCEVAPSGTVAEGTDCNDLDSSTHPGAERECEPFDRDCDGTLDDQDGDSDGWPGCTDCDDGDATVSPDGAETCDGVDQDCDGGVDEDPIAEGPTWYADADGDGYGDAASTTLSCEKPAGYVDNDDDCQDGDAAINPNTTWYYDADRDGHGDPGATATGCVAPSAYVAAGDDCNDKDSGIHPGAPEPDCDDPVDYNCDGSTGYTDSDGDSFPACEECDDTREGVYPGAPETCNDLDDNCDGTVDEDSAVDAATWYQDKDGDAYGVDDVTTAACEQPSGYAAVGGDCDDADPSLNPGTTWYYDGDGDGYGLDSSTTAACEAPAGYAALGGDCDDADADLNPATTWYADKDNDGYGAAASTKTSCSQPVGYVASGTDCDDADKAISPAATELCDGVDNDCEGTVDGADAADAADWYADADGDGYGDASSVETACDQPVGHVADDLDCDDADADENPAAPELCDGDDDDCDGSADESDAVDAIPWYDDGDGDGYGDPATETYACEAPSGMIADGSDCDDSDAAVSPGGTESAGDAIDQDCDGGDACYKDVDGDTYGITTQVSSADLDCSDSGESSVSTDCDDADSGDYPGATETIANGDDEDCDGKESCATDNDGDGYGSTTTKTSSDMDCTDSGEADDVLDCNDASSSISPAAKEVLVDGIDNDCDGYEKCYLDSDLDGYGSTSSTSSSDTDCTDAGESTVKTDCNDGASSISPAATEIWADGADQNCDNGDTCYTDADGDSYGVATAKSSTDLDCSDSGEADDADDCDDGSASDYPGATETVANGDDEDCDGGDTCYYDADYDGFAGSSTIASSDLDCSDSREGSGADDCDDADVNVYPGATETWADGVDGDCDSAETCYKDADGDTYGVATAKSSTDLDCSDSGEADDADDCDDGSASDYPGATETVANGDDEDCDGGDTCYKDGDLDGYAGSSTVASTDTDCTDSGEGSSATDCNDSSTTIYPGATETWADGVDQDCNSGDTCYTDADGDTYGIATAKTSTDLDCTDSGEADDSKDCDDASASDYPGATETVANSDDEDCDGGDTCYVDGDADTYGSTSTVLSTDTDCTDAGEADDAKDCDDASSGVNPAATETCDSVDQDCDGTVDDDPSDGTTYYADADSDGYGDPTVSTKVCSKPSGYLTDSSDCDDGDATINPAGTEICDDQDNDCDGATDWGLRVPDDYTKIQSAINAATAGDTVCVDAGTYTENLDFKGKDITVKGVSGAASTTVKASTTSSPVVSFKTSETSAAVLTGFTVSGGAATAGAGVYISGASPTLDNLIVSGNACSVSTTTSTAYCYGTGVYAATGNPTLTDVTIKSNTQTGYTAYGAGLMVGSGTVVADGLTIASNGQTAGYVADGSGIFVNTGALSLSNSTVEKNTQACTTTACNEYGAGIFTGTGSTLDLDTVIVDANTQSASNSAASTTASIFGAGIALYYPSASDFVDVLVSSNTQSAKSRTNVAYGSGIAAWGSTSTTTTWTTSGLAVTDNTGSATTNNSAGSSVVIGGVYVYSIDADWVDFEVSGNASSASTGTTSCYAGGLFVDDYSDMVLDQGWIAGNSQACGTVNYGAGIAITESAIPTLTNVIVAGNSQKTATTSYGAGIWVYTTATSTAADSGFIGTNLDISKNTCSSTTCRGGGIAIHNTSNTYYIYVTLMNSIVYGNTLSGSTKEGGAVYYYTSSPKGTWTVSYSDFNGNTSSEFKNLSTPVGSSGNISSDPKYTSVSATDPMSWDLALQSSSPCINTGNPGAAYYDPDGSRNNMGSYGGPGGSWP